jgi:hypothetical protein
VGNADSGLTVGAAEPPHPVYASTRWGVSDRGRTAFGRTLNYAVVSTEPIDTSVAHPARRYNYWLGGKDHFAADRASGDAIAVAWPSAPIAARENRRFLRRAVRYLAGEAGIRQFLDIGTGVPTADNTHEVA